MTAAARRPRTEAEHELAYIQRGDRLESKGYDRAKERAAADPFRSYRCPDPECGGSASALHVAWHGQDCPACGAWKMDGVR